MKFIYFARKIINLIRMMRTTRNIDICSFRQKKRYGELWLWWWLTPKASLQTMIARASLTIGFIPSRRRFPCVEWKMMDASKQIGMYLFLNKLTKVLLFGFGDKDNGNLVYLVQMQCKKNVYRLDLHCTLLSYLYYASKSKTTTTTHANAADDI